MKSKTIYKRVSEELWIDPKWLAECFHDYYEITARLKGWRTKKSCQVDFKDLPKENQETMLCTAGKISWEIQQKFHIQPRLHFSSVNAALPNKPLKDKKK